jgi:hypothetical protein
LRQETSDGQYFRLDIESLPEGPATTVKEVDSLTLNKSEKKRGRQNFQSYLRYGRFNH